MVTSTQWQLARAAAERYQRILTPAILGPFARALVDFADLQPGERVVDVGCGTGAAARYAAGIVGGKGRVTAVDVNVGMLAVAQALPPIPGAPIAWREADASHLPLDDAGVDVALCAQTLQFLAQKQASLREMQRVLRPGGRVALSLWCNISENPYFDALVGAMARHVGPETAVGLQAAFALSDPDEIRNLLQSAGFRPVDVSVVQLDLPFPALTEFVPRHVSATPMAAGFDGASPAARQAVVQEVAGTLRRYGVNGRMQIPFRSHTIMCNVPHTPTTTP